MKKVVCQSITAGTTRAFGRKLASQLVSGGTILLQGELGSGKTTFVQGLAEGLNINQPLTSPTFTLINIYSTVHPFVKKLSHIDLFRLTSQDRLTELDLNTLQQEQDSLTMAEWPERAPAVWRNVIGTIEFTSGDTINQRTLTISGQIAPLFE